MAVIINFKTDGSDIPMAYIDKLYVDPNLPIKFLEESIAACIGRNVMKFALQEKIFKDLFGEITINISNETVNIRTQLERDELTDILVEICKNCYITNHLTFKKKLHTKTRTIEI